MTRIEAKEIHKLAMQRLILAMAAVKAADISDATLVTKLCNECQDAYDAAILACSLRTKYAPSI